MTDTTQQRIRTSQSSPMEDNIVHRLLVTTVQLQALSGAIIALLLSIIAALVALIWLITHTPAAALVVGTGCLVASVIDWTLLKMLPRLGLSFGPEKPPALALAGARAGLVGLLGLLPASEWLGLSAAAAVSLAAFYATWIEPFNLGVTVQRYTSANWRSDARPLRLLHIGDLHVERVTARERKLNYLIDQLKPDVIVFSGDFVNISYHHDPQAESDLRAIIGEWRAPLGVWCVPGTYTVEPLERVQDFVRGLDNLRLLTNSWVTLETAGGPLHIMGMVTTHFVDADRPMFKKMMQLAPQGGIKVLLTHAPDVAPEADAAGVDLYLCGHTHGGQLRLPLIGALFTGSIYGRRFVMGRHDLEHTTLYTTRGVGLEGLGAPRARFLCPPEIVLWEIGGRSS